MKTGNFEWTDDTHTEAKFVECADGLYVVTDKGVIFRTKKERAGFHKIPPFGDATGMYPVRYEDCFSLDVEKAAQYYKDCDIVKDNPEAIQEYKDRMKQADGFNTSLSLTDEERLKLLDEAKSYIEQKRNESFYEKLIGHKRQH